MARVRVRKRYVAIITFVIAVLGLSALPSGLQTVTSASGDEVATGPLVAFYGDSYTKGSGASSPAARWSTLVSEAEGWREYNAGVPGLGFVRKRDQVGDVAADVIAQHPDIVIVALGINDNFVWAGNEDRIHDAILPEFEKLRAGLPDARIVVVEPWWFKLDRPASVGHIIDWVHEAAKRIDADYISGASHWLDEDPGWISADGLHPNDSGYEHLATRMLEELDALSPALP
jgi:lysophospholipase L1-like esterase